MRHYMIIKIFCVTVHILISYKLYITLKIHQRYLDLWTPHVVSRWMFALFLVVIFVLRIFLSQVNIYFVISNNKMSL